MKGLNKVNWVFLCLSLLVLISGLQKVSAMPPHPHLEAQIKSGKISLPDSLFDPKHLVEKGINQPCLHPQSPVYPTGTGPVGSYKALVLLVNFSDNPSSVNASFFDTLIFGNQQGCVRHYYREVSYQALDIITVNYPSAVDWYTAPQTYSWYVNGQYGLGSYPRNSQKLVENLVDLVDPVVDFSQYDNDFDGEVDALIVVHAGPGAELTGSTNDIWSHMWGVTWSWSLSLKDGVRIWKYTMQPEYWLSPYDMTCGVYCHELGHTFGLPDLYDTDNSSYGVGLWSLMAVGSWNGPWYMGDSPAHPDAWCMQELGYVTPTIVSANSTGVEIPAVKDSPTIFKLWTNGSPANEYFLVENRQRIGYDLYLPYQGLLIWHVDDNVSTNEDEWYPGHTAYGHYKVALEQSDSLWQMEKKTSAGNGGDPYPGNSNRRTFNYSSNPNSRSYAGSETYVGVENISNSADTMTCNFFVSSSKVEDQGDDDFLPGSYGLEQNYPNPFNPETKIEYSLKEDGWVKLEIFNVLGQKIRTLVDSNKEKGRNVVVWNGTDQAGMSLPSGIYFYRISTDKFQKTNKMILLK
jgi:immune inhibitor A